MPDRWVSIELIAELRRAAQTLDWNQSTPALERALAGLSPAALIELAEATLQDGLDTFEHYHPGKDWPRRALAGQEIRLSPEYAGPGGSSFASAIDDVMEARTRKRDPDACRALIVNALSGSIMAAMCAAWGGEHRDAWDRWYARAREGRAIGGDDPMRGWSDEPEIQRVYLREWNALADRLDALTQGSEDG